MLPGPAAVEDVYCGAHGALAAAGGVRPPLLIDCSTIDPPTAQRIAEAAEAAPLHPEVIRPAHARAKSSSHTALAASWQASTA